jgi:hypothetical protein
MQTEMIRSIVSVLILAITHPVSALISPKHVRRRTTSLCAGIALAYVFLHLLPELANLQSALLERLGESKTNRWFEEHVYVVALVGLLLFQIVDKISRNSNSQGAMLFSYRAELFFFALYSALIGYLVTMQAVLNRPVLLITVALSAHFFGTDIDLSERYNALFIKRGSFVLSIAVIAGMLIAVFLPVNGLVYSAGFSFLAGGILINTLRTEIPDPQNVKNLFLLLGAVLYSVMILFIYYTIRT